MIKPSVQIEDPGKADRESLFKRIKGIATGYVTIGVTEDAGKYPGPNAPSVAEVALWNEFGTSTIPERSFIRSAIDQNGSLIAKWQIQALQNIVLGIWTVAQGLDYIGVNIRELIKSRITGYKIKPRDKKSTIAAKQREGVTPPDMPLYETGLLLRSIERKVYV